MLYLGCGRRFGLIKYFGGRQPCDFYVELREKLCVIITKGLMAKAISDKTGITTDILSRFKNGHICLCDADASKLESYLDKVVIP